MSGILQAVRDHPVNKTDLVSLVVVFRIWWACGKVFIKAMRIDDLSNGVKKHDVLGHVLEYKRRETNKGNRERRNRWKIRRA